MTARDGLKVLCPDCNYQPVQPADMTLMVCQADASRSFYAFTCPFCSQRVQRPALAPTVEWLTARGVRPHVFGLPQAVSDLPPLTTADYITFLRRIRRTDYLTAEMTR